VSFRVARAGLLLVCLILSAVLFRRSREARPVFACLLALACLDVARLLPLPAWADAWAWLCWPAPPCVLAWRAWRGKLAPPAGSQPATTGRSTPRKTISHGVEWPAALGARVASLGARGPWQHAPRVAPWQAVAIGFLTHATAITLPRSFWPAHPWAWALARVAPYWIAPGLSVVAWALRKDEGPDAGGNVEPFAPAGCDVRAVAPTPPPSSASDGLESPHPTPAPRPAQAVAAVLALSAMLDVGVGALAADGAQWWVAWATSGATWAAVAGILARWSIRSPKS